MVDHILYGCKSVPLLSYLKSLGVFKIISRQIDDEAMGYWYHDTFAVKTCLNREKLIDFFLHKYEPAPLFIPWGARSGFYEGGSERQARNALEKLLSIDDKRFNDFKSVAERIKRIIERDFHGTKPREEEKLKFLRILRNELPDHAVEWLDTCYTLTITEAGRLYLPLLGTGGNEGSGSYGSNYLQALQLLFCELGPDSQETASLLKHALFNEGNPKLYSLSTGQFFPGAVAEANASEGFLSKKNVINPWDFVFAMEGTTLFAGAATRRLTNLNSVTASYPFVVEPSGAGVSHMGTDEESRREVFEFWLPLWNQPATYSEIEYMFREGRAEIKRRIATNGLDFARAIASLGVDRGISAFIRYGRLKRQGSGDKANPIAIPLDVMEVRRVKDIRLIDELEPWLNRLRWATSTKEENMGVKYKSHLRDIENAIYNFCKEGSPQSLQQVLRSLGRAEMSFSVGSSPAKKRVPPLSNLSPEWLRASYDYSPEFRIAAALASIWDQRVGPLRRHMEPINEREWGWEEHRPPTVVWGERPLAHNLTAILKRRIMERVRNNIAYVPINGRVKVPLSDISLFIQGRVNDTKIEELLWAFIAIRWWEYTPNKHSIPMHTADTKRPPSIYYLLKALHLPGKISLKVLNGNTQWYVDPDAEGGISIPPVPEVLTLIECKRFDMAIEKAVRRLKASGLPPIGTTKVKGHFPDFLINVDRFRLIASLLIPIWEYNKLLESVISPSLKEKLAEKEVIR